MPSERPEEEQPEKGFTVSDKRLFTKEGQRRESAETPPSPPPHAAAPPPRQEPPRREAPRRHDPPGPRAAADEEAMHGLPPADFATYVTMLATNVMILLGQMPDPMTHQRRRDIPQAKHTIDILIMLREKTRGNLSVEEDQLLRELLPQLQMAYVTASRQVG